MDLPTELIEAFQLDLEDPDVDMASHPASDMASHPDSDSASDPASDMSLDTPFTDPIYHECHAQSLTAKVYLNRPLEELIPVEFLERAENTGAVQRTPWIFRHGVEDGQGVDQTQWSEFNQRFRGVFHALKKVPPFIEGLWEGGCEDCKEQLERGKNGAQLHAARVLLADICDALNIRYSDRNGHLMFHLRSRNLATKTEYWTGYRERFRDAPSTLFGLSLHYARNDRVWPVVPVSSTEKEESFTSALEDKFKTMLVQFLVQAKPLRVAGDKIPDQEVFLFGMHGSKLHLMRLFIPGKKSSSLWCRRDVPGPNPILGYQDIGVSDSPAPSSSSSSPDTAHAMHVEDFDRPSSRAPDANASTASNPTPPQAWRQERLNRMLAEARLAALDNEPEVRTFRILASQEFDLWKREDFQAAATMIAGLQMYLLSGTSQCGVMQEAFRRHPIVRGPPRFVPCPPPAPFARRPLSDITDSFVPRSQRQHPSGRDGGSLANHPYLRLDAPRAGGGGAVGEVDIGALDDEDLFGAMAEERAASLRAEIAREERRRAELTRMIEQIIRVREAEEAEGEV